MSTEQVVLLDEGGHAVGTADKSRVHTAETPLHLAFSCYVFDGAGRVLLTRRAWHKTTWPGALTNTCCGHPGPGEGLEQAVRRRTHQELGLRLLDLTLVLPVFRYRAVMADGTVENEMCPVYVASTRDEVSADPAEVAETIWAPWPEFRRDVLDGTLEVSPWCRQQVSELPDDPRSEPGADRALLPPAAR